MTQEFRQGRGSSQALTLPNSSSARLHCPPAGAAGQPSPPLGSGAGLAALLSLLSSSLSPPWCSDGSNGNQYDSKIPTYVVSHYGSPSPTVLPRLTANWL